MVTIAVVDDDEILRHFLTDLLVGRGYAVESFDLIEPAYDALSAEPPDLLLCDVELPDGSGLELVARLRGVHGEALPVLMLSGRVDESDIVRGYAAGATDYLTKPVSAAQLMAKVSVLLARAGRAGPPAPDGEQLPGGAERAFGRYRVEGVLGQGSYGIVYRAYDLVSRRTVALKVLGGLVARQPDNRMRFLRETYTLASIRDPHVVTVHDFGSTEGRLYFAMDFVPGVSAHAKARRRPATEAEARGLLRGLAVGLAAIQRVNVVHRDLKPANIILLEGRWDRPVIVDFGLAKQPFDRGLTGSDMIMGTPGFMPPELIDGHPPDMPGDIFSAGLVVRFALTGRDVFPDLAGLRLLQAIATSPVDLPTHLAPDFRALLRWMVQIDPARRLRSAADLLRELDRLDASSPTEQIRRP